MDLTLAYICSSLDIALPGPRVKAMYAFSMEDTLGYVMECVVNMGMFCFNFSSLLSVHYAPLQSPGL